MVEVVTLYSTHVWGSHIVYTVVGRTRLKGRPRLPEFCSDF